MENTKFIIAKPFREIINGKLQWATKINYDQQEYEVSGRNLTKLSIAVKQKIKYLQLAIWMMEPIKYALDYQGIGRRAILIEELKGND